MRQAAAIRTGERALPWPPAARFAAGAALVSGALFLGWKAWEVNTTLACWKDEWPQLPMCEAINGRTPAQRWERLGQRLQDNPGDTQALVSRTLLGEHHGLGTVQQRAQLLALAGKAAPQHEGVLLLQAQGALQARQWAQALDPLARLAVHHQNKGATRTLVDLVVLAQGLEPLQEALLRTARTDAAWLDPVVRAMPGMKVPVGDAWFLLDAAMTGQALEPQLAMWVTGRLKAEGLWNEAYRVWLHQWQRPVPLLFNGEFEGEWLSQGFDWEVAGTNDHRAGARVRRVAQPGRGHVLRVAFEGRRFRSPIVRQHLVLPAGHYRFQGDWQSSTLRSEHGLAWVLSCLGAAGGQPRELARSEALRPTGRSWKTWQLEVEVPAQGCGPGLQLALEPQAGFEARAGVHGDMFFDAMSLIVAPAKD